MSDIFKELESLINAELKARGLDITIEVKGSKGGGYLTNFSNTNFKGDQGKNSPIQ
jgi:hypothetical protein